MRYRIELVWCGAWLLRCVELFCSLSRVEVCCVTERLLFRLFYSVVPLSTELYNTLRNPCHQLLALLSQLSQQSDSTDPTTSVTSPTPSSVDDAHSLELIKA